MTETEQEGRTEWAEWAIRVHRKDDCYYYREYLSGGTMCDVKKFYLPNGMAIMWWLVPPHSVQIYPSISDLEHIHSHGKGTTKVVWND